MDTPQDFNGDTWVAFADLCGTKAMYAQSPKTAARALDCFYEAAFALVQRAPQVNGIAVTDCAFFWLTCESGERPMIGEGLGELLGLLKSLHERLLRGKYLLRSTVAYGHFQYDRRRQLPRLMKGMAIGKAYLDAYLLNDQYVPGSIMIVKAPEERTPDDYAPQLLACLLSGGQNGPWEYIWWAESGIPVGVEEAQRQRDEAYDGRFDRLMRAYRGRR